MSPPRSAARRYLPLAALTTGLLALFALVPALADRPAKVAQQPAPTTRQVDATDPATVPPELQQPEISSTSATAPDEAVPESADEPADEPPGDLDGWRHQLTEDFTTPAALGTFDSVYGSRWLTYHGPDTSKRGTYTTSKVLSVANGVLDWHVHTGDGQHNVAAITPRAPGSTYGRYSVRFRADEIPGYKLVVILWPDSDDWGEGEIDFPEVGELVKSEPMCAFLHGPGDYAKSSARCTQVSAAGTGWHTTTIIWEPGKITYLLDDQVVGTHTSKVPSTPFHFVFQVESNLDRRPIPLSASGHIQVDWVKIYSRQ